MKRILVDVDSVVADLMPEWLQLYNEAYDDSLAQDQILGWEIDKFVKPECGKDIYKFLHLSDLYDKVKPIDGALSSIHWLSHHGYDVRYATSGVQEAKIRWLGRNGFLMGEHWMFSPDVIVASDKSVIKGDILVDDNVKNCDNFSGKSILFAQPWNSNFVGEYFRAENWPDVIQYLVTEIR